MTDMYKSTVEFRVEGRLIEIGSALPKPNNPHADPPAYPSHQYIWELYEPTYQGLKMSEGIWFCNAHWYEAGRSFVHKKDRDKPPVLVRHTKRFRIQWIYDDAEIVASTNTFRVMKRELLAEASLGTAWMHECAATYGRLSLFLKDGRPYSDVIR